MQYRWKSGARAPVPAQVAGEVCERLSAEGRLTPRELVDESRDEGAPLHKAFEWDDAKAADAYRMSQASYIIRSVELVREDVSEPVRAFVSVCVTDDGARCYQSIEPTLREAATREAVLEEARRELDAFKRKYRGLEELAAVIAAIEQALAA